MMLMMLMCARKFLFSPALPLSRFSAGLFAPTAKPNEKFPLFTEWLSKLRARERDLNK